MQKNRKKLFVYTAYLRNEKGFNFITVLTMVSLIFLTIPFFSTALQLTKPVHNHQDLAVQEFFRFIRDDIIKSHNSYVIDDALYLHQAEDEIIVISQYTDLVRRQVNQTGHEVYLRDVDELKFYEQAHGIKMIVTTKDGAIYEKLFNLYDAV